MRIKDGTDATTQPFLDLNESYVGLPLRTSDPAAGPGRISYRSDLNQFRFNVNGAWVGAEGITDLLSVGQALVPGTPFNIDLPSGDSVAGFRWMQAVLGPSDDGISASLLIPSNSIPSGPFTSVLYMVDATTDTLYTVNVTTGIATQLPNVLGTSDPAGLASHGGRPVHGGPLH